MIALLGLAVTLLSASPSPPGTLLTIPVSCSYQANGTTTTAQSVAYLVVTAPAIPGLSGPVFFCPGYQQICNTPDGSINPAYVNTLPSGRTVRCLQRAGDGSFNVLEGIQLNDGRVLVDGVPITPDY